MLAELINKEKKNIREKIEKKKYNREKNREKKCKLIQIILV